jgi:drug/metabolite transporter (DMT)-like permease
MTRAFANRETPFTRITLVRLPVAMAAALALIGAAALWGTSFVASKVVLAQLPPVTVACLRFAIAAAVLVPLAYRGCSRPALGPQAMLLGLSGITLFFLCQNAGLRHTSAAHATLILGGGLPILTALFGACVLDERPARRQLVGLCCSVSGVMAVAGFGWAAGSTLRGDGLLLLATIAGATYTILGRRAFAGADMLAVLAGSTGWGALFLVPPALAEVVLTGVPRPSLETVGVLLYLGLGCSALAFALCAFGLRHLTAAQNAIISTVELPVGLLAATVLLGEVLSPLQLVGSVLLLAGATFAVDGRWSLPTIHLKTRVLRFSIPDPVRP